ncbi:MAG: hypothetical protein RL497_403, partial [Pseudomonadota bacterium]
GGKPVLDFIRYFEQLDKLRWTDGSRLRGNDDRFCFVQRSRYEINTRKSEKFMQANIENGPLLFINESPYKSKNFNAPPVGHEAEIERSIR